MPRLKRHPKYPDRDIHGRKRKGCKSPNPLVRQKQPEATEQSPAASGEQCRTIDEALLAGVNHKRYIRRLIKAVEEGEPAACTRYEQLLAQSAPASQTQGDFSDFTVEELKMRRYLNLKQLHQLDATGARFLARTRYPSAFEMCMDDATYAAELNGEDEDDEEPEEEVDNDPDVIYAFKLAEEATPKPAPTPTPVKPPTPPDRPVRLALSRVPESYSEAALERAQPSTGNRRPSLLNLMSNDATSPFGYDDPAERLRFSS